MNDELGPRHGEVKRLLALLRDRRARTEEGAFVLEGPRIVEGALEERGIPLESLYLGPGADVAFAALVSRVRSKGVPVRVLKEGVLEKVGTTRTPQPVLGVTRAVLRSGTTVTGEGPVVVAVDVADPGNLGTILRSAEAAGAAAVMVCGNSVDAQNPKVVRSSAGAIFGVAVNEVEEPVAALEALGAQGRIRLGTHVDGGEAPESVDLAVPCAFVVGNEARGLDERLDAVLDGYVTIPMVTGAESLNVAMAATVLLFESARQRRVRAGASR